MTSNKSPRENQLWQAWFDHQDNDAANELIQHYMYLVNFHVERIASHLPNNVSRDDVRSFGLLGLYDALKKFEAERNLKFDTYASFRIRGSIIDGLRKEDWLPRSLREKTKKIEQVSQQLEQEYQRVPTAKEIGREAGIAAHEVESIVKDALFANLLSIEEKPRDSNEFNEGIGYIIPDKDSDLPEEQLIDYEIRTELINSIKKLNENEQLVISLFYKEELTLTEIGHVLDLTTSRISQIHKKAIFKLRKILNKIKTV